MPWFEFIPLNIVIGIILFWIALGVAGLIAPSNLRYVTHALLPVGAVAGVVLAAAAFAAMTQDAAVRVLPLGLPDLPFHLRLDALSAFFLAMLGLASAGVSVFYSGYLRAGEDNSPGLTCLQFHLFLASMAAIFVADDGYLFMVAWETMALSSYFLVTSNHRDAVTRSAGFLYLLIAHVGAIGILLCFGVLQGGGGDYTFATMRLVEPASQAWATVAYLLALFGFGAKAGLLPLHVWLPEAHPAAPSPVSALMSGVMLKTAIYGLLRVTFDLLNAQVWWWGVLTLALGLVTALFGVLFAAVQTDMKRLLAYSSIAHAGYALIGLVPGTPEGASATMTYAFVYAFMTLGAFGVVIALGERGETLDGYRGLDDTAPRTAGVMFLFLLSLTGIPLTAVFTAKFAVILSAVRAGYIPLALLAVGCSVISAFFYLRVAVLMFMTSSERAAPARFPQTVYAPPESPRVVGTVPLRDAGRSHFLRTHTALPRCVTLRM